MERKKFLVSTGKLEASWVLEGKAGWVFGKLGKAHNQISLALLRYVHELQPFPSKALRQLQFSLQPEIL